MTEIETETESVCANGSHTLSSPSPHMSQIPFQDFLLTTNGFLQNEQYVINLAKVQGLGLLLADKINGPFQVDIRSIKLINMTKILSNMEARPAIPQEAEDTETIGERGR